ncbi:uncharacterized protein N0V89_010143 [Didymosphaeria variabile]|uniref:Uncharacterized protein n=1 Tax=Didymosphaeria variabile TaxID=1932322 RepID=A0A9W9C8B1_9PLEO|nr:uncharacterized protein N0V89_010143 [Didymosphaeria variabile]KAJ4348765.1 hypothetical protein N0V89_010143 [Didymosphaeria variabile]
MSAGDNIVNPSRDPRRRLPAGSASPLHVASPLSMTNGDAGQVGSGNTTPIHGAPPAPSMVPHKRVPVGGNVRGVASIRQAAAKKQMLPGVGSESSALAKIQAKNIELQNQLKKATEQLGQVQIELGKDTRQRNQLETDLRAQLSQMQEELKTEKNQRTKLEERLQKVEEEQSRSSPVTSGLSKQVDNLSDKVKQLEVSSKQEAQPDTAQIENRVKQSVLSDIKAHVTKDTGTKVTSLETRFTGIEKRLDKLKPDLEKSIKQSIKKETEPLQSQLNQLVTKTDSNESRIDGFADEKSKSRVDKLAKDLIVVKTQSNSNEKRIDALFKEDVYLLKEDVEAFKKANLSKQFSDLQSDFATQKENTTQQFQKVESELAEKSTVRQYESLEKQVEAVHGRIKLYVDERLPSHFNGVIKPLQDESLQIVRKVEDIGKYIAENKTALSNLESSTSTSINQLRVDIGGAKSDASAEVERLRSEISDLKASTVPSLTDVRLKVSSLESAISSDNNGLRAELARLRTALGPSSASLKTLILPDHVGAANFHRHSEEFAGRIDRLESENSNIRADINYVKEDLKDATNEASEALSKAKTAFDTTSTIARALDTLQKEVKSLREQPFARSEDTEPALTSRISLTRNYNEAINTVRPDTRAENAAIEARLHTLEMAIKTLTSQYENITTEYLHQHIVHWFTQTYPDAGSFLQELQQIQHKLQPMQQNLNTIGQFVNDIAWMRETPDYGRQLLNLAHNADAIEQLLRDKDRVRHPPAWEDFDNLRSEIKAEAQARAGVSASSVSRDELHALRADLATERSNRESLTDEFKPIHDAFNQTRSQVDALEEKVEDEKALTEQTSRILNGQIETLVTRVNTVESKIEQHGDIVEKCEQFISAYPQTMHYNNIY